MLRSRLYLPISQQVQEIKRCFKFCTYSPNSRCRLSSCILAILLSIYLFRELCEIFRRFLLLYQNNVTSSPELLGGCPFFSHSFMMYYWLNFPYIANVFQIWSTVAGYEELAVGFEPIRNGDVCWMNNNEFYGLKVQDSWKLKWAAEEWLANEKEMRTDWWTVRFRKEVTRI